MTDYKYIELQKRLADMAEENALLRGELHKFKSAVENCPATIVITDANGLIEYANPFFLDITGYTPEEVIGNKPNLLKSGFHSKEFYQSLWRTISSGKVWRGEFYNRKKNGVFYWEQAHIAPVVNEEGKINNYVAIKLDISGSKQAENELKALVATKDKFFSIIAHDLKNPFGAILSFSKMLSENVTEYKPSEIIDISDLINTSAKLAYDLLENLLQWAQSQTGHIRFSPHKISLSQTVDDTWKELQSQASSKNIEIVNTIANDIEIVADDNLLKSIIRNLVSNAIKYSKRGDKIVISAEEVAGYTEISVVDTGMGISYENLDKLFKIDEKYSTYGTAKEKGTGLGLLLCKEFVEQHGGHIWAESEEGRGSKFVFTIPK
jgi:two-component system, sensor histidine kinase and response regulator